MSAAIAERDVAIPSGGDRINAYVAAPAQAPAMAAVIVLHEVWGLDAHIRDVTRRFAAAGFHAIAPDLFSREGPPKGDTIDHVRPFMMAIPDRRVIADLRAVLDFLAASSETRGLRAGSVGFCIGGTWGRMLAAVDWRLGANVDFYGRLRYPAVSEAKPDQPMALVGAMRCPYLGLFGGEDPVIPLADRVELENRLRDAGRTFAIRVYDGAPHAFFNDTRPLHRAAPAAAAWGETLAFLKTHLA